MSQKQTQIKLNTFQGTSIIANTMLGAGLLTLPRALTSKANTPDGWIALILEGVIFIFFIYLNTLIQKKHQYPSLFEYLQEGLGKWIGSIIGLLVCCYFIGVASFETRAMAEMVKFFLLERTPIQVIILAFIGCGIYLIVGGLNDVSRLFPFYLVITIIILLILFCISFMIFDLDNLRPVLGEGLGPVANSLTVVSISFLGVEIMLFLPEHMKKKKKTFRYASFGFLIPILLYILTYIIVVGALTAPEVKTLIWPTISLFQSFELKGIFIERFESFLLIVWIIQFFTTFVIYGYFAANGLKKTFGLSSKKSLILIGAATYFFSLWPDDANKVMMYSDYLGYIFVFLFLLPFILFFIVALKRRITSK
ncbi:spore germination protein [Bacillus cabrialesii]|uniref:Spore germination protein n=1 Tax=Bacillus cabrialesii subsp. tritici TaxID=2944916 RepID=A0ABT9DPN4_9BACI|nr:spore germination protein [Bacillus cabrialesii]MDO8226658.1 spore germination protein [Bacillus cabrialesii subsp. tritici]